MTFRVEFTDEARRQVRVVAAWWGANRPKAPRLFEQELAYVIALLESAPRSAQIFDEIEGKVVRKARMPKTNFGVYFTVESDVVTVHALWLGARGSGPPLL